MLNSELVRRRFVAGDLRPVRAGDPSVSRVPAASVRAETPPVGSAAPPPAIHLTRLTSFIAYHQKSRWPAGHRPAARTAPEGPETWIGRRCGWIRIVGSYADFPDVCADHNDNGSLDRSGPRIGESVETRRPSISISTDAGNETVASESMVRPVLPNRFVSVPIAAGFPIGSSSCPGLRFKDPSSDRRVGPNVDHGEKDGGSTSSAIAIRMMVPVTQLCM